MNPIDAGKIYEYLEQVGALYPRFADNIVDNAVSNVINDIKTFINSLQQEQPSEALEKEYKRFIDCDNGRSMYECARHFYELGLNAREEKPCEDLEKEAKEFAEREYECDSLDRDALEKGFYWGAKWQKEQMMEGAVDATVVETTQIIPGCGSSTGEFKNKGIHLKISEGFEKGEKVKVIIVKEDRT